MTRPIHRSSSVAPRPAGFTLTEVLVVIAVMVLLLGVSVPLFKALTGNRSVDAAQNVIAAALGDARAEAVALGRITGVFFYEDRATQRVAASLVRSIGETRIGSGAGAPVVHPLELISDREPYLLPTGVGVQVLDNCNVQNGIRQDDGYVGLNQPQDQYTNPNDPLRYGGVILFDPRGQLISVPYGFFFARDELVGNQNRHVYTNVGALFYGKAIGSDASGSDYFVPPQNNTATPPLSQFGLVLFDSEAFKGASGTRDDPQLAGAPYDQAEIDEETWLDNNAMPFLINRYSGALIRGE